MKIAHDKQPQKKQKMITIKKKKEPVAQPVKKNTTKEAVAKPV